MWLDMAGEMADWPAMGHWVGSFQIYKNYDQSCKTSVKFQA
jgi:hypothetical protein